MGATKLDLVLINPASRSQVYQSLGSELAAVENPVWAGLMATFCRLKGLSVEIIDAEAEELGADAVAERIDSLRPILAAVVVYGHQPSASTQIMTGAGAVCSAIKQRTREQRVLLVGGHVAALPEQTLREEDTDFVAAGEGLYTLVELVAALKTPVPRLENVSGLWYRSDDGIRRTPDRPLVTDLDGEMPGIAWDLLPVGRYRAHNWHCFGELERRPYAALYTTLGCPYHCSFCCIQAPFRSGERAAGLKNSVNSYRFWSPDRVIEQIDYFVEHHGVRNLKIADEMFVLNRRHVLGLCDRLIERGYGLNIWAYARVDTIKDDMLDRLKAAGFNWLALGIEAGSNRVRADVDKDFGEDELHRVIESVRRAGINVIGNYIFGLPEDDAETMRATLDLATDLNCEFANFYCFPAGTPVWTPEGFKPIEGLVRGSRVYGRNGVTTVRAVGRRFAEALYTIKPRYLPSLRCSGEHPFLVARCRRQRNRPTRGQVEWVAARDLRCFNPDDPSREYHALMINKKSFRREKTHVDLSKYVLGQVGPGRRGGQLNGVGKRYLKPMPVTRELAELFGWYVAEGCIASRKNKQVAFCLGLHEQENIERIQHLLRVCLGFKSRVLPVSGENCVKVQFTSKVFVRAVHDLFGADARRKFVPDFIMNAEDEVVRAFLRGYIGGDGTSRPNANKQLRISSSSERLMGQVAMLFLKIGIMPSFFKEKSSVAVFAPGGKPSRSYGRAPQWSISWVGDRKDGWRSYFEDDHWYYVPVRSVKRRAGKHLVYNISTADETYAIPWIVHNCAMAYPGSPLHERAVRQDVPLPARWTGFSQHARDCLPLPTRHLPAREVLRFRDEAFVRYFTNPRYLDMLRHRFGPETVGQVERMTSHRLERDVLTGRLAVPDRLLPAEDTETRRTSLAQLELASG